MMKIISPISLDVADNLLINKAIEIRAFAYAPYSGYKVGAALIDVNGNIHTGCNIESADLTLTSHAEMVAIDSMVKSGCLNFTKITIALAGIGTKPGTPCGLCRQKMAEFDKAGNSEILIANLDSLEKITNIWKTSLKELLPYSFNNEFLNIGI